MPAAITTKNNMPGIKRKSAPVKVARVNDSKKPKIDSDLRSTLKSKSKTKPEPAKIVEQSNDSEEDSDDYDNYGGAPLYDAPADSSEKDEDSESAATPKYADGLHPDRAKAAVTNSELFTSPLKPLTDNS